MTSWLATVLILLPMAGGLIVWTLPFRRYWAGAVGLLFALAEVAVWIEAVIRFDFGSSSPQFEQRTKWFGDLNISYHVGLYGFSLWLTGLAVVVMAASIAYGFWVGRDRARGYFGLMLFLTGAIVAVFAAQDVVLFYAAFEAMLIPLYVLVGNWGGPGRLGATFKFVAYTMAGSLLMLVAVIIFGLSQGTFDLVDAGTSGSDWLFLGFVAAFVVKAPLFPFHGWLPDAYREASPEVSAVLSGVVSKAAVYGFLRIAIAKFPGPADHFHGALLVLAAIGVVYGSLVAFRAPDLRGVVAYSSLAQMSLITFGIFAFNDLGFDGAILQSVNHGLVSAALFLLAGTIERRTSTGEFALLGGMARGRPLLATALMASGIITLAVPGSANFAGEFLILAGVFRQGWAYSVVGAIAIVLAAMYSLRLISAVLHERRGSAVTDAALDLRPGELAIVVPLVGCLLALSVWPDGISSRSLPPGQSPAAVGSTRQAAGQNPAEVAANRSSRTIVAQPQRRGVATTASAVGASRTALYQRDVLAARPALYLPLGMNAKAAVGPNGKVTGRSGSPVTFGNAGPTPMLGTAAHFPGGTTIDPAHASRVQVARYVHPANTPITVEYWAKVPNAQDNAAFDFVNSFSGGDTLEIDPAWPVDGGGHFEAIFGQADHWLNVPGMEAHYGIWAYYVFTADASAWKLYVDGRRVASTRGGIPTTALGRNPEVSGMAIGASTPSPTYMRPYAIDLAHVAIYRRVLRADEIAKHYAAAATQNPRDHRSVGKSPPANSAGSDEE
jgi:NADH-quinone oxidoreductase subunit M